jgi:uncharacterized repeat protein (TIGR01451 family)
MIFFNQRRSVCERLGCYYRPILATLVFLGTSSALGTAVSAQEVFTVPNVANGNFRGQNLSTPRNTRSNQVLFPAQTVPVSLEIIKVGDRAAAEPGDTVVYRLQITNTGIRTLNNVVITDTLPLGLKFIDKSVRASSGNADVQLSSPPTVQGRTITFLYPQLQPRQTLTLVYAALVTPDAVRGNGRNLAQAQGLFRGQVVPSNQASHLLRIRPGILSDCGTIVGRVFVDKNFDGEQQPGEPGVPNAVIFMEDGNRITTDANGLYSLASVLAGYHTGTLDLSSLPGYTIAPNHYRIEANSPSRLVRVSPGGMARMNFAVTPSFREGQP